MTYPTQQRVSGQNVGKIKISISIVAADEWYHMTGHVGLLVRT